MRLALRINYGTMPRSHLKQIAVRKLLDGRPLGHILGQIENRHAVVMLADLDEVIGTCSIKQIHPLFGVECVGCEILNEVVVNHVRSVRLQMMLIRMDRVVWSLV